MLTYLAVALPRYTSPAARLLAVQCALRADARGRVRFPDGLLRGMWLRGRRELWEELAHANWLAPSDVRSQGWQVQLLDSAMWDRTAGCRARRQAAHWALRPAPLRLPSATHPALRVTALVLAAHRLQQPCERMDMESLARLSGHSPLQTADLLDRLVITGILATWRPVRGTDEVLWQFAFRLCEALHRLLPSPGKPTSLPREITH